MITTLYLLSTFLSIFVNPERLMEYGYALELRPSTFLVYGLLLCITIAPSVRLRRPQVDWSQRSSALDFVVKWSWPLLLFAVIYLTPFAIKSIDAGAELVRGTLLKEEGVLPSTPLTTVAVGVAQFFSLFIMLWFYASIKKYPRLLQHSLLLGPLAGLLWGLIFASRDVLIWIPLCFLLGYWYWYDQLSERFKGAFGKLFAVIVISTISIFALFTAQRFSGSRHGVVDSIFAYFGYQPYVFSEMVTTHQEFYGLSLRFPFIAELLGTYKQVVRYVPYEWQFGTLLADFYGVSGWQSLIVLCGLLLIFPAWVFGRARIPAESHLIIMILYFNILTQGVFYFRLGSTSGNQYIFIMLAFSVFLAAKYGLDKRLVSK